MKTTNATVSKKTAPVSKAGVQKTTVVKGENKKAVVVPVTGKRGRKPQTEEEKAQNREKSLQNIAAFRNEAIKSIAADLDLETLTEKYIKKHEDEINEVALELYKASKGENKKAGGARGIGSLVSKFLAKRWEANMKRKEKKQLSLVDFKLKVVEAVNGFMSETPVVEETPEVTEGTESTELEGVDELEEVET
jgi:hypothetical protein